MSKGIGKWGFSGPYRWITTEIIYGTKEDYQDSIQIINFSPTTKK